MNLEFVDDGLIKLELTKAQLLVAMACIRESFATIDRREFPLRVGARIEDVDAMSEELVELIKIAGIRE